MFILSEKNLKNYSFINSTYVGEIGSDVVELEHKKTKCKIVLMINDDINSAFNISFKTFPYNDNGICHIMEHSVLCGSKKFNVKDPFFLMAKTSLATFLNAMTGIDMTYYPFASANFKDYCNLMDVYLDAVFFPNIYNNEFILKQEGWHYEISDDDKICINGVVYNEMNGANSVPSDLIQTYSRKDLYHGTKYQYNFGGVAKDIISISYDEFLEFHKKYYNPSNAYIYLYGKFDMNERLEYIDKEYLSNIDYVEVENEVFDIKKIDSINGTYYFNSDENSNKSYVSYNFLFSDNKNNIDYIVIGILIYILFYKEGALLKDKIIDAGICENVNVNVETSIKNGYISVVAENIDLNNKDKFIETVDDVIKDIIENGINENVIKSSINSSYINTVEADPGSLTSGLLYIFNSLETYSNGYPVDNYLKYEDSFRELNSLDLSDKDNIFIKNLKNIFLNPIKKCVTTLSPKANYTKDQEKEIDDIINNNIKNTKIDDIKKQYKEYIEYANADDNPDCIKTIPRLQVSDINRDMRVITSNTLIINNKDVIATFDNTGELAYIGVDFYMPKNIDGFVNDDVIILSIMLDMLGVLDTKNYTYQELNTLIDMYTGGINCSIIFDENTPVIRISAKTKLNYIDKTYEIINEIIHNTKFDDYNRIKQKLIEFKIYSNDSISSYVNVASSYRSMSNISYSSFLKDKMVKGCVAYDMFINDLVKSYDSIYESLVESFINVKNKYFRYNNMFLDCCMKINFFDEYKIYTEKFLSDFNKDNGDFIDALPDGFDFSKYVKKDKEEVFIINSNVNFVSRSFVFDKKYYDGHFLVLNNIINYEYLHNKIRVEGGAYGARLSLQRNGYMSFLSYSDPNLIKTDDTYINTKKFLINNVITNDNLCLNIIGSIKKIESHPIPYGKHLRNLNCYLQNIDDNYYNKLRSDMIDTKIEDLYEYYNLFDDINDADFCALIKSSDNEIAIKKYKNVRKLKV